VNYSLLIKETNQHWLDVASHLPCLLRSRWPRTFPLTGLSFVFRVVGVNPGFVTRNDIRKKTGVISGIFFEVQANVKSLLFLVDTQESGHEIWCDTSHLQISVKILWQVPWLIPTSIQTSSIVRRRSSRIIWRTLSIISSVELDTGRPERSSSSVEVLPALNRENHWNVLEQPIACSPKAVFNIS